MVSSSFDPWRAQFRLEWRNRFARWRDTPGESAFHAGIWLALAALLAWLAASAWQRKEMAEALGAAVLRWPAATLAMLLAVMTMAQSRRLGVLREVAVHGWLHAQPVAERVFAWRRFRASVVGCVVQCLSAAVLLEWLRLPSAAWLAVMLVSLAAAMLAAVLEARASARGMGKAGSKPMLRSRLVDAGAGSLWRWQKIEASLALHGRNLAPGLFVLLLIPMGAGMLVVAASLIVALTMAVAATAWQRMLAVFPAAQRWLGTQPMHWRDLMRDGVPLPLVLLVVASTAAGGLLFVPGMRSLSAMTFTALLFACGVLHLLVNLAERARPSRIPLTTTLHLVLLLCILQTLPPAAPIFWLIQTIWLLRRSMEPKR